MSDQRAASVRMQEFAIEKRVPVLYCDLDGTVREGKDDSLGRFVNGPEDVVVFPEAIAQIRRWKQNGGRVVAVSNQGGVALGLVSFDKVAAAMMETQRQCEGMFDRIAWCVHHPRADDPDMARCWCRKPSPGLVIESALGMARQFDEMYPPQLGLFVGDRLEDQQCADRAGLDFKWAGEWREESER